jgi:signal transduction histidine kinase
LRSFASLKGFGTAKKVSMMGTATNIARTTAVRYNRRFLQPLAVALVFSLFGVLFFSMAMMDLSRLEALLLDVIKKKAIYTVELVEKSAIEKYRLLMHNENDYGSLYTGFVVDEKASSLQEVLARALIDAARSIDFQEPTETSAQARLRDLASSESFRAIALFDEGGNLVYQSSPLPADIAAGGRTLVKGRDYIIVRLFQDTDKEDSVGFVGIRKEDGKGAVILTLDGEGLEYWAWRTAVQSSVEELQWGRGFVYLAIEDARGRTIARSGNGPEEIIEECLLVAGSVRDPESPVGQCVRVGDTKFLELSFPFQLDGYAVGTTRIGIETHETDQLLIENRRHIFLWTGLMVIIGLLAMGTLYQTQNRHVARIQTMQERLHHAERLSSLGKLGAGVAHEIRNPLNAISMATQRLQREFAPEENEKKESFDRITYIVRDEIKRLNGIVEDFLSLSRTNRMDFRQQSIEDLLERIVFLIRDQAEEKGVRIKKCWASPAPLVYMDAARMEQAMLNIARNAVESVSGEGSVEISCERERKNCVSVRISDTGEGIPPGEEKRIFDPFYTTKDNGVGLGLSIAREIILAHGGEIRVMRGEGEGTTFEILLNHDE